MRTLYSVDVVIPCYNEQDALPLTAPIMLDFFRQLVASDDNRVVSCRLFMVDDGSTDETWSIIGDLANDHPEICGIKLSRNFGHQAAMMAGLSHADAEAIITLDADLQDDLDAVTAMIAAYEQGAHLALGVRSDRSVDSKVKHGTASAYYRLLALIGIKIIHNHADYRLMSRTALQALLAHREVNLFLRGLIPTIGFPIVLIPYQRRVRAAGETKYTWRKMLRLALDGITSFSVVPLRMIAGVGALVFLGTLICIIFFLTMWVLDTEAFVPGWASTVLPMLLLGGLQLLSTGILGEYVGKIYMETKQRPRFLVEEIMKRQGEGEDSVQSLVSR